MTEDGMPRELISREVLDRRVGELAAEIERDYADSEELLCVGVLKGSVFFMSDLLQRLSRPLVVDFFQTSSYRGETTSPGEVRIRPRPRPLSCRPRRSAHRGHRGYRLHDADDHGADGVQGGAFRAALRAARQGLQARDAGSDPLPRLRGGRRVRRRLRPGLRTTATATCPTSACWTRRTRSSALRIASLRRGVRLAHSRQVLPLHSRGRAHPGAVHPDGGRSGGGYGGAGAGAGGARGLPEPPAGGPDAAYAGPADRVRRRKRWRRRGGDGKSAGPGRTGGRDERCRRRPGVALCAGLAGR